jgi:hypothetical protein
MPPVRRTPRTVKNTPGTGRAAPRTNGGTRRPSRQDSGDGEDPAARVRKAAALIARATRMLDEAEKSLKVAGLGLDALLTGDTDVPETPQ